VKRRQDGFGLLEVTLALALGLMLMAAVGQLFVSAHQNWRLQSTAVRMHSEARLALLRMAQDIRMAGMFGCLRLQPGDIRSLSARQAFARPLEIEGATLRLVVAELPGHPGAPEWFVQTDCVEEVIVEKERSEGKFYPLAYPISTYVYQLQGNTLKFKRAAGRLQPLVEHVQDMRIERVQTPGGERVDIALTLHEPSLGIRQQHALSVAIRNPVASP